MRKTWMLAPILITALVLVGSALVSAEKIQLTLFTYPESGRPDWFEAGAKEFMARNPDIEVTVVNGWISKFHVMVAGGVAPDVLNYDAQYLPALAVQGNLMPLDQYMKDFNPGPYIQSVLNELRWKGHQYGLPRDVNICAIRYNMDLFEARGVAYVNENWTWDDLVTNGKKLTFDTNGDGWADVYGYMDTFNNSLLNPQFVWSSGGEFWNEDYTKSTLNTPEALRAYQFWWDLYHDIGIAPNTKVPGFKDPNPWTHFQQGKIAIMLETRGRISSVQQPFRVGVAPTIKGPVRRTSGFTLGFLGIHPSSKNPDAAWRLIKFLSSREGFQAGREENRHQGFYALLSPIRNQALEQILQDKRDGEIGGEWWLAMSEIARITPITHPGDPTFRVGGPDWTQVEAGKSIWDSLNEQVEINNKRIQELLSRGIRW